MQKPGPDGAAGTARPLSVAPAQGDRVRVSHQAVVRTAPRGRCATAALPKMLVGGVCVSRQVAVLGGGVEGAERGRRFFLSLYKNEVCFFYFFLSRWKGSERSRGNLRMVPP